MITELLIRLFIKDRTKTDCPKVRTAYATLASGVGILLNIFLFIGKLCMGILAGSVAIIADAFNNITDAGSSVVLWIGIRLSGKHVDKKHPLGHGRMEYITGFIVDMLIILVGFELLTSSFEKILNPSLPHAGIVTFIILGASILIKLWLFFFYRSIGNRTDSAALRAVAIDSLSDCAATSLVFVCSILGQQFGWMIDGYVGVVVALVILFAGIRAAKETIDLLLGTQPDPAFIQSISEFVKRYPEIIGIHDVMVHDYGIGRTFISFHAEIPSDFNINLAHEIIDQAERDMYDEFRSLVTIHLDPIAVNDEEVNAMRLFAMECMKEVNETFSLHDFRMTKGEHHINLIFDLVIPVDYDGEEEDAAKLVAQKIKEKNPNCFPVIQSEHPFC